MNSLVQSVVLMMLGGLGSLAATQYFFWRSGVQQKASALAAEEKAKAQALAFDNQLLVNRIVDLEKTVSLVSQAVVPISTAFQAILIKELTHFHTPVTDALMTKVGPPNTLTAVDEVQLAVALQERTHDMAANISESEREAAIMLPYVIKRAKREAALLKSDSPVILKLVSITLPPSHESEPSHEPK